MKYHCRPPKCLGRATRIIHSSKFPSWSRSHPSSTPLILAVMVPDATSWSQYVEYHRMPVGPDRAPGRMNPLRESRFKSSFNPSCKHARARGLGISVILWSASSLPGVNKQRSGIKRLSTIFPRNWERIGNARAWHFHAEGEAPDSKWRGRHPEAAIVADVCFAPDFVCKTLRCTANEQ
jgi:hypothetical protein